jgi:multiple sugar transport system permease protein
MAAGSLTAHRGAAPRHGARMPTIKTAVIAATAYVIAIIFLLPYAEMLITALRPQRELLERNYLPHHFAWLNLTNM